MHMALAISIFAKRQAHFARVASRWFVIYTRGLWPRAAIPQKWSPDQLSQTGRVFYSRNNSFQAWQKTGQPE